MYYSSYYDRIGKTKEEPNNNNYNKFNDLKNILHNYKLNQLIIKIITKHDKEKLEPEYLYFKLKEDMPKLEKYIQDPQYRKELEKEEQDSGIGHTFYTNYELMDLLWIRKKGKREIKNSRKFNN